MPSIVIRSVMAVAFGAFALLGGAAGAQARTEIQFWHAMEGQLGETVGELVKQFNESQTEFHVQAVYKGPYSEVLISAINAYRRSAPPHLVQVYEVGTQSMLLSRAIVPIHRLMEQQKIRIDWTDFLKTVSSYYSLKGRLFSMPFNSSSPILYYNKDAFRKAGLPDAPPGTWKEVEAASRKILAAGAARCGFTTSWPSWTMLENTFAWHDQPFATNANGYSGLDTRLLLNGRFGQMHVGVLAAWQKDNIYSYGGRWAEADAKFLAGDCAMLVQSSAVIGGFTRTAKFPWGTGQLPHWGPPYQKANSILGGATLWALRGHAPREYTGIAKFLEFIAAPARQAWWAATTGYVPITTAAVKKLVEGDFFTTHPEQRTALSQLLNARPTANTQGLRLGNYVEVREAIELELESIFAGKKTVKEGLDAAVVRGNAILRQFALSARPWPRDI